MTQHTRAIVSKRKGRGTWFTRSPAANFGRDKFAWFEFEFDTWGEAMFFANIITNPHGMLDRAHEDGTEMGYALAQHAQSTSAYIDKYYPKDWGDCE